MIISDENDRKLKEWQRIHEPRYRNSTEYKVMKALSILSFLIFFFGGMFVTCIVTHAEELGGIELTPPESQEGDEELTEVPYGHLRKALWYRETFDHVVAYAKELEKEVEERDEFITDLEKEKEAWKEKAIENIIKVQKRQGDLGTGLIIGGSLVGGLIITDMLINLFK